jgi:metal-sulfur cluster biosynthetic enzyme
MTDATPIDASAPNAPALERGSAIPPDEIERLTDDIVAALKTVYDPEIPSDIYELGLIYRVDIEDDRTVTIDMTLTAPGCPWPARCRAGSRTRSPWCRASRT